MKIYQKPENFPLEITASFVLLILLAKLFFFFQYDFQGKLPLFLASFAQDVFLLILNYLFFSLLIKIKINSKYLKLFFKSLFCLSHIAIVFISLSYTELISDVINYPVNIFRVDFGIVSFFFKYFVSAASLISFVVLTIAFSLVPLSPLWKISKKVYKISAVILAALFIPTLFKSPINPVLYSFREEIKTFIAPSPYANDINRLNKPSDNYSAKYNFDFLDKRLGKTERLKMNYDKVVVFVMESVSYDELMKLSENKNVLWRNNEQTGCQIHDNYFTTNLDSYPSLLAMLYSMLFPYKAYSNDVNLSSIEANNNLVRFFNSNGFSTNFIATYDENPYLIDGKEWSQTLERKDFDEDGFVCLNVNRVDSACEDRIAMKKIIETLRSKKKAFIFHEMVYGHLTLWEKETGIGQIDYYDSFFNEFYRELSTNGLSDHTLIVIVSDHGPRTDSMNTNNYHIPLILCADDLKSGVDHNFSSHLDFKDILFEKIVGSKPKLARQIYTVGSSKQWVYGKIADDGSYAFIDNQSLNVKTNSNREDIVELNRGFQGYLSYFQKYIVRPFE